MKRFERFGLELELGVATDENGRFDEAVKTAIDSIRFVDNGCEYSHNNGTKWMLGGDGSVSFRESECDGTVRHCDCDSCTDCPHNVVLNDIGKEVYGRELTTPIMRWNRSPKDIARLESVMGVYKDFLWNGLATTEHAGMHCHLSSEFAGDGKPIAHTARLANFFRNLWKRRNELVGDARLKDGDNPTWMRACVMSVMSGIFRFYFVETLNAMVKSEGVLAKFPDRYDGDYTEKVTFQNFGEHCTWFNTSKVDLVVNFDRKNRLGSLRINSDHCEMRIGASTGDYQEAVDYVKWSQEFCRKLWKTVETKMTNLCKKFYARWDADDEKGRNIISTTVIGLWECYLRGYDWSSAESLVKELTK